MDKNLLATCQKIILKRHATKAFDDKTSFSNEEISVLIEVLRLSPSSVNSQPWHFIVATSAEGKARLNVGASAAPYSNNFPKIRDAAAVVLYCTKTEISDEYLQELIDLEAAVGRFPQAEQQAQGYAGRLHYVNLHRQIQCDAAVWMRQQIYLNLGFTVANLAHLGWDCVPIEGLDFAALDAEFELPAQGLSATVALAIGQGSMANFNANLPKARWPQERVVTLI